MDQPAQPTIPVTPPSRSILLPILISSVVSLLLGLVLGKYLFSTPSNDLLVPIVPTHTPTQILLPTPVSGLTTYTNAKLGFQFQYPSYYLDITSSAPLGYLAKFKHPDNDSTFTLLYDSNPYSLDYLKKYAPTGGEAFTPEPRMFGHNTFFYYGAGGGGVNYPDQFFTPLNGHTLIISFDGPYLNSKSPSENTILLESQILSTFEFSVTTPLTGTYCAGPSNLPCPQGYACKLVTPGNIALGGTCQPEAETNP